MFDALSTYLTRVNLESAPFPPLVTPWLEEAAVFSDLDELNLSIKSDFIPLISQPLVIHG